jgi:peptide chain release factor
MWIQISSGRGPAECAKAINLFFNKILIKLFNENKIGYRVISSENDLYKDTLKSILIYIKESNNLSFINHYEGTIQWINSSPFRKGHKRKNWFFNLIIFNEPKNYTFSLNDIKTETTHSSGPGGQNVNKVETAVKIIHLPTGITVNSQEERSQALNKKLALAKLEKKICSLNDNQIEKKKTELWQQHNSLERGNAVKVYIGDKFILKK